MYITMELLYQFAHALIVVPDRLAIGAAVQVLAYKVGIRIILSIIDYQFQKRQDFSAFHWSRPLESFGVFFFPGRPLVSGWDSASSLRRRKALARKSLDMTVPLGISRILAMS